MGADPAWRRDEDEREVARLRGELGETAFTEAWEAGRMLTADEAVALALAELRCGRVALRARSRRRSRTIGCANSQHAESPVRGTAPSPSPVPLAQILVREHRDLGDMPHREVTDRRRL